MKKRKPTKRSAKRKISQTAQAIKRLIKAGLSATLKSTTRIIQKLNENKLGLLNLAVSVWLLAKVNALEAKVDALAGLFQQVSIIMYLNLMALSAQFEHVTNSIISLFGGQPS